MGIKDAYEKLHEVPKSTPEQHAATQKEYDDGERRATDFVNHIFEDESFLNTLKIIVTQKNHLVYMMSDSWGIICNFRLEYTIRSGPRLNQSLNLSEVVDERVCENFDQIDQTVAELIRRNNSFLAPRPVSI